MVPAMIYLCNLAHSLDVRVARIEQQILDGQFNKKIP